MKLTQDQWMAMLRVLLAAGGPVAALLVSFGLPADQATTLTSSLLAIAGAAGPAISIIWGLITHSDKGTIVAAEQLANRSGGTIRVAVTPSAEPEIKAIGDDPTRPGVVTVNELPMQERPLVKKGSSPR